uniref:Uncharacterized protein n=1 Tax=Rhizophora mucronata TaxID=61149 RepID=A0A2P2QIA9_RHIMU
MECQVGNPLADTLPYDWTSVDSCLVDWYVSLVYGSSIYLG